MVTFNRLSPPLADNVSKPDSEAADSGADQSAGSVFPVQGPGSYLADALGIESFSGPTYEGSLTDLTAPEVLCNRCKHGHILKSRAATQNRKPDGSPFYFLFGQCLRVAPPMSLDDLRVEHCNQFEAVATTKIENGDST